ncbi:hypothetical protein CLTEP_01140 [Clostridium tepidiprofundi DSM 19306]|uniref:Cupin type-2 domain-containing protein n=1 Tax=Clostridium tepidiprofundi DSM 19306 TaxID=1121338 RepID=A0A151B706_9CLOT|nr:cupin domain-containing protein [Clostridium tepidiprofundi]KYH35721.1 hypothetical protein CLTEP_01140 [Clostridium tepidiprofundi DSM 19306]
MIVSNKKNVKEIKIDNPNAKNALMKVLISPKEGWDGYVMRVFKIGKDGYTPRHSHTWPHINYIISGRGKIYLDGKEHEVEEGSYAYIPSNKEHQFMNVGNEELEFICIVPEEGHK